MFNQFDHFPCRSSFLPQTQMIMIELLNYVYSISCTIKKPEIQEFFSFTFMLNLLKIFYLNGVNRRQGKCLVDQMQISASEDRKLVKIISIDLTIWRNEWHSMRAFISFWYKMSTDFSSTDFFYYIKWDMILEYFFFSFFCCFLSSFSFWFTVKVLRWIDWPIIEQIVKKYSCVWRLTKKKDKNHWINLYVNFTCMALLKRNLSKSISIFHIFLMIKVG